MFEYFCKLERVVDGDTIDVNIDLGFQVWHRARVRMLGIDTPEKKNKKQSRKGVRHGEYGQTKRIIERKASQD